MAWHVLATTPAPARYLHHDAYYSHQAEEESNDTHAEQTFLHQEETPEQRWGNEEAPADFSSFDGMGGRRLLGSAKSRMSNLRGSMLARGQAATIDGDAQQ